MEIVFKFKDEIKGILGLINGDAIGMLPRSVLLSGMKFILELLSDGNYRRIIQGNTESNQGT